MNWFQLNRSVKYYTLSRHRKGYGIHSPFVFELIDLVFNKPVSRDHVKQIKSARNFLLSRNEIINVNDLGAGPVNKKANNRRVSGIVKNTAVRPAYGRVLYNLAKIYNKKNILEMGTSSGISTLYMAMGAPSSRIITIEGCQAISDIAADSFYRNKINNIEIVRGNFDNKLSDIISSGFIPDYIFVDGNHRKAPTLAYFSYLLKHVNTESVIVFDDIHYSAQMEEAWNEIKSNSQVSVSIDIFQMGLIFFRTGIVKQDYVIRY